VAKLILQKWTGNGNSNKNGQWRNLLREGVGVALVVAFDFLSDSVWPVVAHDYLPSSILFAGVAVLPNIRK
jgi:hypothetical protein